MYKLVKITIEEACRRPKKIELKYSPMVAGKTLIQNTIVLVLRKRENNRAKIKTVGRKVVFVKSHKTF